MKLTRKSLISGKFHTMDIPVTPEEIDAYVAGDKDVQQVFPQLSKEQREFIKTGITPEEWQTHVKDAEDDEPFDLEGEQD